MSKKKENKTKTKPKGCDVCKNSGLKNRDSLCPECNGSPYGV